MKNVSRNVAWYSADRIPAILSLSSNISISLVAAAGDFIVYAKFSENNVIIRPSRYFYREG